MDGKIGYLWLADYGVSVRRRFNASLFFSSVEKFQELCGSNFNNESFDQLLEVTLPHDFDDWDYIPDNY